MALGFTGATLLLLLTLAIGLSLFFHFSWLSVARAHRRLSVESLFLGFKARREKQAGPHHRRGGQGRAHRNRGSAAGQDRGGGAGADRAAAGGAQARAGGARKATAAVRRYPGLRPAAAGAAGPHPDAPGNRQRRDGWNSPHA
ncbi:DNA translocase FtsK 4TM domain-containing protein [Cupriavidus basilensis]